MKTDITALIITKNTEACLERCLVSVSWMQNILVVDAFSSDDTEKIAKKAGAKFIQNQWKGYGDQRNFGLKHIDTEWTYTIDADEEMTPELSLEIQNILSRATPCNFFKNPRKTFFLTKWLLHGGWYPNIGTKLFRSSQGTFTKERVHESLKVAGSGGILKEDLLHYSYPDLETYLEKMNLYTSLAAQDLHEKNFRTGPFQIVFFTFWIFFLKYFLLLGFVDGIAGFLAAFLSSNYVLAKYVKLWLLNRSKKTL